MASTLRKISTELGVVTILHAPRDLHFIFLTRFLRMIAYGGVALILALFFSGLAISDARIGLFMTLTLLGDVLLSLLLTLVADAAGRRKILLLGSASMVLSGVTFALASNYWILLLAAVVGVISVSGNEIGPFRAVEESTLADLVGEEGRSDVFAWYVVVGTLGSAVGSMGAGWLVEGLKRRQGLGDVDAYRMVFWCYAAIGMVKSVVTLLLSRRCEVDGYKPVGQEPVSQGRDSESEQEEFLRPRRSSDADDSPNSNPDDSPDDLPPPPTPPKPKMGFSQLSGKTRWTLLKLCALFAVDSLASGMVPYSLINFYVDRRFHIPKSTLGNIMSAVWVMSSIGNIFASAISKRIGLIKTMVFTHLPSAVLLALLPTPQVIWLTVVFLVGRGTLASMDQAPRSAFLSKVVKTEERTAVMGIVNVVKTLSQSSGPTITGVLAGEGKFWIAFVVAGAMKASYDLGLLTLFLGLEKNTARAPSEAEAGLQGQYSDSVDELEVGTSDDETEREAPTTKK